jgi:hypothetical protein
MSIQFQTWGGGGGEAARDLNTFPQKIQNGANTQTTEIKMIIECNWPITKHTHI